MRERASALNERPMRGTRVRLERVAMLLRAQQFAPDFGGECGSYTRLHGFRVHADLSDRPPALI